FGFFILGFQGLHLLLFNKQRFFKMGINYLFVLALYLPCVFNLFTRFNASVKGTWVEPPSGIESLYNMLWSFSNAPVITVTCITILVFTLIKIFISQAYLRLKENSLI